MFKTLLGVLLTAAVAVPAVATASTCEFGEVTDHSFASAKHIFVFRVLSTEIRESRGVSLGHEVGHGRLRVVENLRGKAPHRTFSFSASRSCGSRFVPGRYYLGISMGDGTNLAAGPDTALDLGSEYREGIDNAKAFRSFAGLVLAATGKQPLSALFPPSRRLPIEYFPLPPPPPTCGREDP